MRAISAHHAAESYCSRKTCSAMPVPAGKFSGVIEEIRNQERNASSDSGKPGGLRKKTAYSEAAASPMTACSAKTGHYGFPLSTIFDMRSGGLLGGESYRVSARPLLAADSALLDFVEQRFVA